MPLVDTTYSSPNYADRGDDAVELIVLHATVGSLQSAISHLVNPRTKVSTHYLISKTGRILRLVAESNVAWHAGRAKWKNTTKVNEISIGIDCEACERWAERFKASDLVLREKRVASKALAALRQPQTKRVPKQDRRCCAARCGQQGVPLVRRAKTWWHLPCWERAQTWDSPNESNDGKEGNG